MSNHPPKLSDEQLLELGKKLQDFYDYGYVNRKQALSFALIKGIATGLGVFIGGTIVVALVLGILGQFNEAPLVGPVVDAINNAVNNPTSNTMNGYGVPK